MGHRHQSEQDDGGIETIETLATTARPARGGLIRRINKPSRAVQPAESRQAVI
ncbi:hypothetical protein PGTUg99_006075 [Puccinia graminis f. sp. tritici]|uniref:Uncharacterized protein n=1 Tax=Puccinia graminis f. sp. tritici TaxID=56615 RepID=A0A5B0NTU5_PUCGR|nr:hypothetical protein PGTUg99_006075 [Puccinia graminis f. sp. tritici]